MLTTFLLLLSTVPRVDAARESCEVIEVNHFYDQDGRPVFCQAIFWETSGRCRAWRMDNGRKINPAGNVVCFMDGGIVRQVTARTVSETWTQHDPEVADRELLPKANRRELKR